MNEEDSSQMGLFLEQHGYLPAASADDADIILLNTCSVRQKPEDKVHSKLGELRILKESRPDIIIGVCGCMAQVQAQQIARRAPHVDFISGTGHNAEVPGLIEMVRERRLRGGSDQLPLMRLDLPARKGAVVTDVPLRTLARPAALRAYVPIMYGCDRYCTFCVVPLTRGRERSRTMDDIIAEVRALARAGTREVTLLGQTVNSYGRHLPGPPVTLADLLRCLGEIIGIERIRFTSPHPCGFDDDLIEVIATVPQVCEHVHLPLQAADDELLRRMKRGYTVEQYRTVLDKLRDRVPGIAITTDIMLGFPGETEDQFQATLDFVREVRFDSAFMFAYSPRPGTRAASMPDQVPHDVKIRRLSELIELQNAITTEINASLVGSVQEVLVEGPSPRKPSRASGLTRTFKTVHIMPDDPAGRDRTPSAGDFVSVVVVEGGLTGLQGVIREESGVPRALGDIGSVRTGTTVARASDKTNLRIAETARQQ